MGARLAAQFAEASHSLLSIVHSYGLLGPHEFAADLKVNAEVFGKFGNGDSDVLHRRCNPSARFRRRRQR